MIVSMRQNVLQVRPQLRHKMWNVAIGPATAIRSGRGDRRHPSHPLGRSELLIGTNIHVTGRTGPNGILNADEIMPMDDYSAAPPGAMFGKIVSAGAGVLQIRPRYSTDIVSVHLAPACTIQQQIPVNPDSVKAGDTVTFWAMQIPWMRQPAAIMLFVGGGCYPPLLAGNGRDVFLTGRLDSIDPTRLTPAGGRRITLTMPPHLTVARILPKTVQDLKPGSDAMFVLAADPAGGFTARAIVLDATPWPGYGR
jgi:hypothetical protein